MNYDPIFEEAEDDVYYIEDLSVDDVDLSAEDVKLLKDFGAVE